MAILKKVEKKNSPPPEVIPSGYEKYVTFDPKESDDLSTIANSEGDQKEPRVKHLGQRVLEDGRYERSFLKKIVKKAGLYALVLSLLFSGNAFAYRSDANFDETRDFADRQVNTSLTEVFARTRAGAELRPVSIIYGAAELTLASGDLYIITGDTTVARIAVASTWAGRKVTFVRGQGTANSVQFTDGGNLSLMGNRVLGSGDSLTLACFDDINWQQVASSDN